MRKYVAVIALLLLPAAALAQGRARGERGRMGVPGGDAQRNVVEIVLEHKTELSLTRDQTEKLQPIAKKLDDQNKAIVEELRKLRGAGTRPQDMTEEQREQMRAQTKRMRENRTSALDELRTVLNDEQMKKVRELIRPEGRRGGRGK